MKKLLFLFLFIPFLGVAQNNIAIKGMMSLNTTDTAAIQNYRTSLQSSYGNTGGLYYDKTRNKWRVWQGVCPDTAFHNGCWVDLLSNGGTSVSGVRFANNGVSLSGDTVQLMGPLTKNTLVNTNNKDLVFEDNSGIRGDLAIGFFNGSYIQNYVSDISYTHQSQLNQNVFSNSPYLFDYAMSGGNFRIRTDTFGLSNFSTTKTRFLIDSLGNISMPNTKHFDIDLSTKKLTIAHSGDTTIKIHPVSQTASLIPNMSIKDAISVGSNSLASQGLASSFWNGLLVEGNDGRGLEMFHAGDAIQLGVFYNPANSYSGIGFNKTPTGRNYAPADDSYINFGTNSSVKFGYNDTTVFHYDHTNFYLDKIVTTADNSQTHLLTRDASTGKLRLRDASSLVGSPAGSDTQIQFNNSGSFGASASFVWDNSNNILGVGSSRLFTTVSGTNLFLGNSAGNVTGSGNTNTGIGFQSLTALTSANENTSLGYISLNAITSGSSNTAIGVGSLDIATTAAQNSALGAGTLQAVTSGSGNVVIGYGSGNNLSTGSDNIGIGRNISFPSATASNQVVIGTLLKRDNAGEVFLTVTRTSCAGAPSGSLANVAGVLTICP